MDGRGIEGWGGYEMSTDAINEEISRIYRILVKLHG